MSTLVVFADGHWLRLAREEIVSRGADIADALPAEEGEIVVGVIPACDTVVRVLNLPDLSNAQANAAARLTLGEQSLIGAENLHVATGPADDSGRRTVVAVDATRIFAQLQAFAEHGLDPDHLLVAPLLLPFPEADYIRATVGDEAIVRGRETGFLDDPALTGAIVGATPITTLDRAALEAAIIDAVCAPVADLRHGPFAKRTPWALDIVRLRRFAVMVLILGVLVLVTQIVAVIRLNATASQIETQNVVRATAALPTGTVVTDPAVQAEARLTAMRGAGGGFGALASAFATAVNATPNVELGGMVFDGEGGLRATVRGASAADLSAIEARLAVSGLRADPGPIVSNQGRPYRDITVRLP